MSVLAFSKSCYPNDLQNLASQLYQGQNCSTELVQKIAELRSKQIFGTVGLQNQGSSQLEQIKRGIEVLEAIQREPGSLHSHFHRLPQEYQSFLYWGIWINDSLENGDRGLNHGQTVFQQNPHVILQHPMHKVIYCNGNSLVEQLTHYLRDQYALECQREQCRANPSQANRESLEKLELAQDLAQYDQMLLLRPLLRTDTERNTYENYLSQRVREWIQETGELYESRGAQFSQNGTTFSVYAPHAQNVQCIFTAFGHDRDVLQMHRQHDGTWTLQTDKPRPGQTYLYRVKGSDGKVTDRCDPFSFGNIHVSEKDRVESVLVDRNNFVWTDDQWNAERAHSEPLKKPLSIYEIHVKSWERSGKKNAREMAPEIANYCKEMGFTHVELYGVMEHFWGGARGYQITNFFAPHHTFGSYDDFKYFVNYLHENKIGVIIDWIPSHFDHGGGPERHLTASMNQFDGTDLFGGGYSPWGTRFFDYGKEETRRLMEASALWWIEEFHVDALRFDAVTELIHREGHDIPAGISFLKNLNHKIHRKHPGVFTIAEASGWHSGLTEKDGIGFDLNWNIGGAFIMRDYLKTPQNERSADRHHYGKLEHLLRDRHDQHIATHSHDDTDGGNVHNHSKALINITPHYSSHDQKRADIRNFHAWQIFRPSFGHLIHMGDELAQRESWYGRFIAKHSAVDWTGGDYQMQSFVRDCITHYKQNPDFYCEGPNNFVLLDSHPSNKLVAYARGDMVVVHNFSDRAFPMYDISVADSQFAHAVQSVREVLNSSRREYGGQQPLLNDNISILRDHGMKLRLKIPALSTLVLKAEK